MFIVAGLVTGVLVATHLALGWRLGFHSPSAYLISWIFFAIAGLPAWRLARFLTPSSSLLEVTIRTAVLSFAAIVFAGLTLGGLHLIGIVAYLCLFAAGAIASGFLVLRDFPAEPPARAPFSVALVLVPLLACVVAVGLLRSPLTLYDGLSYHLVFPARWLQQSSLSIIQTPFSDPAQAYQPGNGELFFLWLMLPFHGDLLARIGQLPFLLLAGMALYGVARRSGVAPQHAVYAPTLLFLARPVVEQAVGADVDLVCAAMFVTSLYLGLVAVDSDRRRDWALWGVALGLYAGSKYLAIVYLGVLLLLPLVRGIRRRALWSLPGLALFALPWYVRNWVIAGSPLYPSSLSVFGLVVAPGAFSRQAMNNSVFHVTSLRLFPAIAAHGFGTAYALVWLPTAGLGIASLAARRRWWWPGGFVVLVPFLIGALFWAALPDNADSRFLLPGVVVASVLPAFAFGSNRRWNGCLHTVYILAAVWMIVGVHRQIPATLPWFMGDWLALDGIVAPDSLGVFAVGTAATLCVALIAVRMHLSSWWVPVAVSVGALSLTLGWPVPKSAENLALLSLSPTYVRAGMITGWEWTAAHVRDSVVANTGNNVPYPLFGEHLTNRVEYINIDRHASWRFHDYARARSRGLLGVHSFAEPSGQLMPLVRGNPNAPRPRFERWEGDQDAWVANLRAAGVSHLFVTVLSAYELGFNWHNEGGFPIEDAWARDDPARFRLLYENGQVRLYAVAQP